MGSTAWVAGSVGLALGLLAGWWLGTRELDAPSDDEGELLPAWAPVGTPESRGSAEEPGGAAPRLIPGEPSSTAAGRARGNGRAGVLGPDGRVQSVPSALPELFAEALRARHAAQAEGSVLAEEEVAARVADLPESIDRLVNEALDRATWRAKQLRQLPLLHDPVELVLQIATRGRGQVGVLQARREGRGPIDIAQLPTDGREEYFTQGGILPAGKVLLVEEVVLRMIPAPGMGVSCELASDGPPVRVGTCLGPHRSLLRGRVIIDERRESWINLGVKGGGAEAVLRGRLVDRVSRPREPSSLTLVESEGGGFLGSDEVLLQMLAVHQGGNPCTVNLVGESNGYVRDLRAAPVWLEPASGPLQGDGRYHVRGTGSIPPGKVYEITRVACRGWITRGSNPRGRVEVRLGGAQILTSDSPTETEFQAVWTGSHIVLPGGEPHVNVTASYHSCVEARIEGRLVDASVVGPDGKIAR